MGSALKPTAPEDRLREAGLPLPVAPTPRGLYAPFCKMPMGNACWVSVSGQTSRQAGVALQGMCRDEGDVKDAQLAAEVAALNALAALRAACGGTLARVNQVLRMRGFIRTTTDFELHSRVLDAASRVIGLAFPGHAPAARTAVGVASLPASAWIEIELDAIVEPAAILNE